MSSQHRLIVLLCRFLSIMGSLDLIEEAGSRLHGFATELVPPLKKALDTREPTVVCIAVELMIAVLKNDPQVIYLYTTGCHCPVSQMIVR